MAGWQVASLAVSKHLVCALLLPSTLSLLPLSILHISMLHSQTPLFSFPIHHSFLFISSEFPPLFSLLNHPLFPSSSSSNPSIPLSFKGM
ncbi:unnamed protein product [Citrullus colocynthis]|uniref:Uncharacterized protein n=1 Tax=Citrullus colocynthis TaxID=252529 RepID=A0ABP0YZP9_9ROSI